MEEVGDVDLVRVCELGEELWFFFFMCVGGGGSFCLWFVEEFIFGVCLGGEVVFNEVSGLIIF